MLLTFSRGRGRGEHCGLRHRIEDMLGISTAAPLAMEWLERPVVRGTSKKAEKHSH